MGVGSNSLAENHPGASRGRRGPIAARHSAKSESALIAQRTAMSVPKILRQRGEHAYGDYDQQQETAPEMLVLVRRGRNVSRPEMGIIVHASILAGTAIYWWP